MECPYCEQELDCIDYYGHYLGKDTWDKIGDIFKCSNEECESEAFNYFFIQIDRMIYMKDIHAKVKI